MNTKLRLIRLQQRISQWKLAKETGVVQSKISLYENNMPSYKVGKKRLFDKQELDKWMQTKKDKPKSKMGGGD